MDREEYLQECSNMKCQRVEESFVPSLEDEGMEVEHLRAEPRNDHISVNGSLASHTTLNGKDDLGLEVLDGFLDDVEINDLEGTGGFLDDVEIGDLEGTDGFLDDVEINDLEGTDGFSDACGGYFLDFEFAKKADVLGSNACEGSLLQNSNSESPSSGFSGSSIVDGISESTKVPIAQSTCKNESLDETVTYDSHGFLRNIPRQPSNVDCMYDISLDIQHLYELNNVYPLAGGILSSEKENVLVEKCQPAPPKDKRLRKPTKRYIEESSNLRSKEKVPTTGTENKCWAVSPCDELHSRIKELKKIPGKESSNGNSDVTLSELKRRRGRPKKEKLESANEPLPSESEDKCFRPKTSRRKDRRKHQRMWTVSEVTKLVDGISEYGVGRWTDIKRSLFSSSSYRTPIDIRDKWRNLLRASSSQKFNKKEAEQDDECALRPLSSNVARRVLELAKLYPYPRCGSKKSCNSQIDSSVIASQSKGSPSPSNSIGRRNVRRKKCT